MTTKEQVLLDRQMGGVDSTSEGTLVAPEKWIQHHNMRPFNGRIQQVARKVSVGQFETCHPHTVLGLHNLPSGRLDQGFLVALTPECAWQIRNPVSSSVKLWDETGPLIFEYDDQYRRWGTTHYNGQLFFVNELNPVAVTDGASVRFTGTDSPRAKYITHYYDHLVVGWVGMDGVVMPGRAHWSHLYSTSQWRPGRGNEADFFDFEEDVRDYSAMRGVTGFAKLADTLFVITPNSIRPMQYVGLPKVFRVGLDTSGGIGNSLQWGAITVGNSVFFFDAHEFNFFSFGSQGLNAIGGPIQGFLQANVTQDPELVQRTWAYYRPEYTEITWVFCSNQSSGAFDLAVSFNVRTGQWFTSSVEDVHSFAGAIRPAKTISQATGAVWEQTGTVAQVNNSQEKLPRYWGSSSGRIIREETSSDAIGSLLEQETPVLESRDYHYEAPQNVKEVDTVSLHTTYTNARGVNVEVATRVFVDDAVAYKQPIVWAPGHSVQRLSNLRRAGCIFRYKFSPISIGDPTTSSYNCPVASPPLHGRLQIELKSQAGHPDYGVTIEGPTDTYSLRPESAPVESQFYYIYFAGPDADPYALPQSAAMLQATAEYSEVFFPALGYDGWTKPAWVYSSSPTQGWVHSRWPGWTTVPPGPDFTGGGWYPTTQGYLTTFNPGLGDSYSTDPVVQLSSVAGIPGTAYQATIRVRAVVPLMAYNGGSNNGAYLQIGGTPLDSSGEVLKLQIGAAVYYLNRGSSSGFVRALDYSFTVDVSGGETIELSLDNQDGTHRSVDEYSRVVRASGLPASASLKALVDYTLALKSGTARVIGVATGGGVRGWKWSGYVQNVYSGGAER